MQTAHSERLKGDPQARHVKWGIQIVAMLTHIPGPCSWSRYLVLEAIVWAFIAKKSQNFPENILIEVPRVWRG